MGNDARQLIATISEEGTDALVRQLRAGARTETELRRATDLSHRAAHERLSKLQGLGVIEETTRATTGPGRPPREWKLTNATAIERFLRQAEALGAALKRRR
jgi:predicted ArsR family transcriptional regulator